MKELSLKDFLSSYPHIFLATEADNSDILNFYNQQSLASKQSEIIYERGENFFSFLKERSKNSLVMIMKNDDGKIQGMGVLSFRPGFIDGRPVTVGYLGDLRVKLNRKLIREWRLMYANLIRLSPLMKETFHCSHYQTVLIDDNIESQNNLAETKIENLHYHLLARYKMVNILGRIKLNRYSHHLRWATPLDKIMILDFLGKQVRRNLFAHDWTVEFERRLLEWKNFEISNYILVFDQQGNLLAATSVWNPVATKQVKLAKIQRHLKILFPVLKVMPLLEVKELPEENKVIDILYVNQIAFEDGLDRTELKSITQQIMHFAFKRKFHLLAYADFGNENFLDDAPTLIMQKIPMALYSVHYKEEDGSIVAPLKWFGEDATPTFDMSLV